MAPERADDNPDGTDEPACEDLGWFAAKLAHELANIGNALALNSQLARSLLERGDLSTAGTALEQVGHGSDRLVRCIGSLRMLALSPIGPLANTPQPLPALLDLAAEAAAVELKDRARLATAEPEPALPRWHGHEDAFSLVVRLLAANAVEADAGRIGLSAGRVGDRLQVVVDDDGSGIDAAAADRMFEPFVTSRRQAGHLGLGLWLARRLCGQQGIELTCTGTDPGRTRFVLSQAIPAQPVDA